MNLNDLNKFEPGKVDLEQYQSFKDTLESLQGDISPLVAFKLADKANRLIDYYTTVRTKAEGELEDSQVDLDYIKSKKSIELDSNNVSNGKRLAETDKEVIRQKKYVNQVKRYVNYLNGLIKKLEKDHYLMKQRHAEGEKEYGRSD